MIEMPVIQRVLICAFFIAISGKALAEESTYLDESREVLVWNYKCEGVRLLHNGGSWAENEWFAYRVDDGEIRKASYQWGIYISAPGSDNIFDEVDIRLEELKSGETLYIRNIKPGSKTNTYALGDNFDVAYKVEVERCADPLEHVWE